MALITRGEPMKATATESSTTERPAIESPYFTYDGSARYCNVERTTIYRAVKNGRLRASGPGMAVRFHRDELDRWMDSRNRK
jgi:excisionase family DNA binding protein